MVVKSALRTLLVIELLTEHEQGLTFVELSDRLQLPKSSTHGILQTMTDRGHLQFDPVSRRFRLGIRLWQAGRAYSRAFNLPELAKPAMEAARESLSETVQLAVLDGLENVYIAKVEAEQRLVLASQVGMRLPAYATGLGKALLSDLPDEEVVRRVTSSPSPMQRFTAATITDLDDLLADLAAVRDRGYARDNGEYTEGVFCIAVPIRSHSGDAVAAMSVSVPHVRVTPETEQRMIDVLLTQAARCSSALGYVGDIPGATSRAKAAGTTLFARGGNQYSPNRKRSSHMRT